MYTLDAVRGAAAARFPALAGYPAEDHVVQKLSVLLGCFMLLGMGALWVTTLASDARLMTHCSTTPVQPTFGAERIVAMSVAAGTPCAMPLLFSPGSIHGLAITTPPKHGTAAPRGYIGVTYRADANYRGPDEFEIRLRGRSPGQYGNAIVRVRVDVR